MEYSENVKTSNQSIQMLPEFEKVLDYFYIEG